MINIQLEQNNNNSMLMIYFPLLIQLIFTRPQNQQAHLRRILLDEIDYYEKCKSYYLITYLQHIVLRILSNSINYQNNYNLQYNIQTQKLTIAMHNSIFQDVINLLMDIKITLQKHKIPSSQSILQNIDLCISKIAPLLHVYAQNNNNFNINQTPNKLQRNRMISHQQSLTSKQFFSHSKNTQNTKKEQLSRVNKSFIENQSQETNDIIDYFMLKYDLKLGKYLILGRKGGEKADRNVFLDLFTFDKNNLDMQKLQKSHSMTKLFKLVYNSEKIKDPFILPNCQQQNTKYLFVFELSQCATIQKDFYRTSTMFCFVTRSFILAQLTNLMDLIAKTCFEQRISQISPIQNVGQLQKAISSLNIKKYFANIESTIQKFIESTDFNNHQTNLTMSTTSKWQLNTLDKYLEKSSLRLSFIRKKKSKQQKWFLTLVILFYFLIVQHKIVILSQTSNKHLISELMVGLLEAINPLTYIYPIVAATISAHHMQFINSPVPLMFGVWGSQEMYEIAKTNLKNFLKIQKSMSAQQLKQETLMVVIDIEGQNILLLQQQQKEALFFIQKIQNYIEDRFNGSISNKLSCFMSQLLAITKNSKQKEAEWILSLRKAIHQTQMYEYLTHKTK